MSILYDTPMNVMVFGPKTDELSAICQGMADYGTFVVAHVNPDKTDPIEGLPHYVTVEEAIEHDGPIDICIILAEGRRVRDYAIESIASKIGLTVIIPDDVPVYDCIEIIREARENNVHVLGPGSQGLLNPGVGMLGMLPLHCGFPPSHHLPPGPLAIVTRTASLGLMLLNSLKKGGLGVSTLLHVGTADFLLGMQFEQALFLLENDQQTRGALLCPRACQQDFSSICRAVERGMFSKPLIVLTPSETAQTDFRTDQHFDDVRLTTLIGQLRQCGIPVVHSFELVQDIIKEKLPL